MLGLGAGVDYALFLVARFRARLRAGDDVVTAAARANSTTGTAVVTAGALVVVSICGLAVTGITIIGRMGLAAAVVVAVAALTTVTVVPAALRLAGRRVLPRAERALAPVDDVPRRRCGGPADATVAEESEGRRARALARWVAAGPWPVALVSTVLLLALGAPALGLQLGQPDDSNRPAGDTMRVAYDRLAEGFGPGFNGPLLVALDLRDAADPARRDAGRRRAAAATPGVAAVAPAQTDPSGDTAPSSPSSPHDRAAGRATSELVGTLRDDVLPAALEAPARSRTSAGRRPRSTTSRHQGVRQPRPARRRGRRALARAADASPSARSSCRSSAPCSTCSPSARPTAS